MPCIPKNTIHNQVMRALSYPIHIPIRPTAASDPNQRSPVHRNALDRITTRIVLFLLIPHPACFCSSSLHSSSVTSISLTMKPSLSFIAFAMLSSPTSVSSSPASSSSSITVGLRLWCPDLLVPAPEVPPSTKNPSCRIRAAVHRAGCLLCPFRWRPLRPFRP